DRRGAGLDRAAVDDRRGAADRHAGKVAGTDIAAGGNADIAVAVDADAAIVPGDPAAVGDGTALAPAHAVEIEAADRTGHGDRAHAAVDRDAALDIAAAGIAYGAAAVQPHAIARRAQRRDLAGIDDGADRADPDDNAAALVAGDEDAVVPDIAAGCEQN